MLSDILIFVFNSGGQVVLSTFRLEDLALFTHVATYKLGHSFVRFIMMQ